jgi:hypothetical protein
VTKGNRHVAARRRFVVLQELRQGRSVVSAVTLRAVARPLVLYFVIIVDAATSSSSSAVDLADIRVL